ncbi:MAG: M56 family metallopeptidase [Planctomycetaceae bacterium]
MFPGISSLTAIVSVSTFFQTLLHFLWQGTLIAFAALLISRTFCRHSAQRRYLVYTAALLACPLCAVATLALGTLSESSAGAATALPVELANPTESSLTAKADDGMNGLAASASALPALHPETGQSTVIGQFRPESSVVAQRSTANNAASTTSNPGMTEHPAFTWKHWVSWVYATGVFVLLLRLIIALPSAGRLSQAGSHIVDPALLNIIQSQAQRLGLKCAPIVKSCERIAVPVVIGVLRPVVLIPVSMITGLSPEEFSSIISHELAHIRRFDLWINLIQRIVEAFLFFHPAVWFLSQRVSVEREICCDDLAMMSGHTPIEYAGSLLKMAELCLGQSEPVVALAATGRDPSILEGRISRLLSGKHSRELFLTSRQVWLCSAGVMLAFCSAAGTLPRVIGEEPAKVAAVQEATTVHKDTIAQKDATTKNSDTSNAPTTSNASRLAQASLVVPELRLASLLFQAFRTLNPPVSSGIHSKPKEPDWKALEELLNPPASPGIHSKANQLVDKGQIDAAGNAAAEQLSEMYRELQCGRMSSRCLEKKNFGGAVRIALNTPMGIQRNHLLDAIIFKLEEEKSRSIVTYDRKILIDLLMEEKTQSDEDSKSSPPLRLWHSADLLNQYISTTDSPSTKLTYLYELSNRLLEQGDFADADQSLDRMIQIVRSHPGTIQQGVLGKLQDEDLIQLFIAMHYVRKTRAAQMLGDASAEKTTLQTIAELNLPDSHSIFNMVTRLQVRLLTDHPTACQKKIRQLPEYSQLMVAARLMADDEMDKGWKLTQSLLETSLEKLTAGPRPEASPYWVLNPFVDITRELIKAGRTEDAFLVMSSLPDSRQWASAYFEYALQLVEYGEDDIPHWIQRMPQREAQEAMRKGVTRKPLSALMAQLKSNDDVPAGNSRLK